MSKFRIDLAVRHREHPTVYVAGIECDGAAYHSSRSARDRDPLREEVLRGLGWNIVRVWSTDWFADPAAATRRLVQEILRLEAVAPRDRGSVVFGRGDIEVAVDAEQFAAEAEAAGPQQVEMTAADPPIMTDANSDQRQPAISLDRGGPLTRAEAKAALVQFRRSIIEIEMPAADPECAILRDAMIELFVGVRFMDPERWFEFVPTHLRRG